MITPISRTLEARALKKALVFAGNLVFQETPSISDADLDHGAKTLVRHAAFAAVVEARFGAARGKGLLEAHVERAKLSHRCVPHLVELAQLLVRGSPSQGSLESDFPGVVHEHMLAVALTRGRRGIELGHSPEVARRRGAHYTPRGLVRFMVEASLGRWLKPERSREELRALRVLDPACGAGVFLLAALDVLEKFHAPNARRGIARSSLRHELAERHLFGVDLDPGALEATKLSLDLQILGEPEEGSERVLFNLARNGTFSSHFVRGDALVLPLAHPLPAAGFDVVLGNPPYVAGELVAPEERAAYRRFELGRRGQSDLWKLFFERTTCEFLRPGGVQAFVVPDALLGRDEHADVRRLLARQLEITRLCHVGRVFERAGSRATVGVSGLVVVGERRTAPVSSKSDSGGACAVEEWTANGTGAVRELPRASVVRADGSPWTIHAPAGWADLKARLEAASVPLGSLLARGPLGITRGEELGKSSLARCRVRGRPARGHVAILAGEDVERFFVHLAGVQAPEGALRKPGAYFGAPRILLVKTGAGPVAAASFDDTRVLQSVYVLHLKGVVRERLDEDAVAGVLSSALVTAFVFYEWTSGKRTQPQLTIREVKSLPIPDPARTPGVLWSELGALAARVRAGLEAGETTTLAREERALDTLVARLFGLDLEEWLPVLEPAFAKLPRSQRPRWSRE